MSRCPWKIRWTYGRDTQCEREEHVSQDALLRQVPQHHGPSGFMPAQTISWLGGDRREFTGDWPGPCTKLAGCVLHVGHQGRCAP